MSYYYLETDRLISQLTRERIDAQDAAETYHAAWQDRSGLTRTEAQLSVALGTAEADRDRYFGGLVKAKVELEMVELAAETYHDAWVDSATYWKDKVAALELEVARLRHLEEYDGT